MNNNTTLKLNIASYFINILASPDESTWNTICRSIKKETNHLGLNKHHRRTVGIKWHMVYRGKYDKALWSTLPLKTFWWTHTTHLIISHHHHKGFNSVWNCTVRLVFLRLQPKRTNMQNIQKGMKNEGKRKEAWLRQTKQWLIMLNIF